MPPITTPTLRLERQLLRSGHTSVAGLDEVGRGCLAGPVTVGLTVVTAHTPTVPQGTRDSKDLTAKARQALLPKLCDWAADYAVGSATADEIDALGITPALALAAQRAWQTLQTPADVIILDGKHNWLKDSLQVPVHTVIKGDQKCSSVAAGSVLAKCHRDDFMAKASLDYPHYDWANNKGYASRSHIAALTEHGPCPLHRTSWKLPGVPTPVTDPLF